MSDGRKKLLPSRETGTVPKVKYWKNATVLPDSHVSNNLASSLMPNGDRSLLKCETRNRQRCSNHECFEDACLDDYKILPNFNSLPHINMSNGITSHNTSVPAHNRQSSGTIRKCDNVTKYPDKQQIEEKLDQIREYVKVTNSMMSNIKEDQIHRESDAQELYQMLSALRDSEKKLECLLINREMNGEQADTASVPNHEDFESSGSTQESQEQQILNMFQNNVAQQSDISEKLFVSERKLQALHEHQSMLMHLQEKAENHMKDAKKAQERLAAHANSFPYSVTPFNGVNQQEQKRDKNRCSVSPDVGLQDQMGVLNSSTEGREQMLRLLDARDNELCGEQMALQQKLHDLNSKKQQINQLVSQLHNYSIGEDGEEGTDEMAKQIKQIVTMKEQLATLKDMLSMVKSTEADLLRQNSIATAASEQQQMHVKSGNMVKEESVGRAESVSSDRRWGSIGKTSNKSSISSSREQLQAELQAKKQELEEFMYKDQDRTTAINRDVCNELMMDKGDQPFSLDSVPSSWTLLQDTTPPRESCVSRENIYSSDEDEIQNYQQLNNADSLKAPGFEQHNFRKPVPCRPVLNCNPIMQETPTSPSVSQQWNGVEQKQVELMTNLCQSLLEQQRHMLPNQFSVPNFQWYASYMQTQHSLMLSTISQCCQLLWLQQQDINTLMNTVSVMQNQPVKPSHPVKAQVPVESVSSACSMPNLSARLGSSNTQYPVLGRDHPSCSTPGRSANRNSTIPVIGQPVQPMWNGNQALNNQVAPGNRANNYWDNFRSYSRQNLLSTSAKSNEGSQNSLPVLERNIDNSLGQVMSQPRSQPSTLSKMNSRTQGRAPSAELNNYPQPQQDVHQAARQNQAAKSTKRNKAPGRNRNEWNKDAAQLENLPQKSKLFDMLRENVYKEVTLLISANENRPHFLIQLFRDLQLISSDPLRRSALHSIQNLITHSIGDSINVGHESPFNSIETEQLLKIYPPIPEQIKSSEASAIQFCPQQSGAINSTEDYKLDSDTHHVLMELLPFIKSHSDDIMHNSLVDIIKIMIFQLLPAKHFAADNKLHSKLDSLLSESLIKYQGRRVLDIKEELLKTIADILLEVLQTTTAVKDHPVIENHPKPEENLTNQMFLLPANNVLPFEFMNLGNVRTVDNGDLAEADQSTQEAENEEGAVGGMILPTTEGHDLQTNNCDVCF